MSIPAPNNTSKVHLRNNLMEVEAGEKSQRRGLRINIGDFDEMVSEWLLMLLLTLLGSLHQHRRLR